MKSGTHAKAGVIALLLALFAGHGLGAEEPEGKVRKALRLWHVQGDHRAALDAFNDAVSSDPDDTDARFQRALFLWQLSGAIEDAAESKRIEDAALADLRAVAEKDPASKVAAVARDSIAKMQGRNLFPWKDAECSEEAQKVYHDAESRFHAQDFEGAVPLYERAQKLCPEHAHTALGFADAHYAQGDYAKARKLFRRAIEIEPWFKDAHRFLSDTEARLGDLEAARREAALAVLSDPSYEAGWRNLLEMTEATGRRLVRVYGDKARVTSESGGNVKIALPRSVEKDDGEPDVDSVGWLMYGMSLAGTLTDEPVRVPGVATPGPDATPLERERYAVASALQAIAEADVRESDGDFWAMMARAKRASFLDEAIFLHLIDEGLVPEYVKMRPEKKERLLTYIETVLTLAAP